MERSSVRDLKLLDENSTKTSEEPSREGDDGLSTPALASGSTAPKTSVPRSPTSVCIDHSEPSTSADINTLDIYKLTNTKKQSQDINFGHDVKILNGINCGPSTSSPMQGIKRKSVRNHYEEKRRKRQKTYHYNTAASVGGKKHKLAFEQSGQAEKRIKTSENENLAIENELFDFNSAYATKTGSNTDNTSCSKSTTQTGDSSFSVPTVSLKPDDPVSEDNKSADEVPPCSKSCVCKAGPSKLPLVLDRKFDTPEPLYKSCLLRRIYSLTNTKFMCCKNRCVKKHSREEIMEENLSRMNDDYYKSDMSVHQYSWGEWKE